MSCVLSVSKVQKGSLSVSICSAFIKGNKKQFNTKENKCQGFIFLIEEKRSLLVSSFTLLFSPNSQSSLYYKLYLEYDTLLTITCRAVARAALS